LQVAGGAGIAGSLFVGGGTMSVTDGVNFTLQLKSGGSGVGLLTSTSGTNSFAFGNGAVAEVMRTTNLGNLLIGGTTDISGSGGLKVFGTTASTSTTTGALQVAGGVGVAGSLFAGATNLGIGGNTASTNSLVLHGYAVGGFGDYGSVLLSASSANTSAARQVLVTNAHNATGFAIIRSTDATTPPTLDASGAISSGTLNLGISNVGALTVPGTGTHTFGTTNTVTMAAGVLATTGAATFGGAIAIGNTVNTVSPTSPDRTITMVVGGTTYYIAAKTTND
jgi:hypothetical protein